MANITRITESELKNMILGVASRIISEGINGDDGIESYTHFAVNKADGKIVNGWDYSDYDPSELRQFKNDYFFNDLKDYGLNPKEYTILTKNRLIRDGIDPLDQSNWSNF